MASAAAGGDAAAAAPPPPATLDRDAFRRVVKVPALRIPKQRCSELMRTFKGFTLDKPKTRCVVQDGASEDTRLLLLRDDLSSAEAAAEALPAELRAVISDLGLSWSTFDLEFDYRHLTTEQVLKQLLPPGVDVPSSFESIGHIAHMNLKEEVLPYKRLIGQVIVDKNPHITTVVNKVGTIENEYRVFNMEVLAGEPSFETEVVQHGLKFRLDFSKVYWNSRLETEHNRLVNLFQPSDVIADIMAGIGPFAVPAGLRGCTVYANDLNPESARYLSTNIRLNRLAGRVLPFKMDGRQFVRLLLATPGGPAGALMAAAAAGGQQEQQQQQQQQQPAELAGSGAATAAAAPGGEKQGAAAPAAGGNQQQQRRPKGASRTDEEPPPDMPPGFAPPPGGVVFQYAVMNLPASAVEFLDAFRGAFDPDTWRGRLPMVHCYTFMKGEGEEGVIARVEAALGGKLDAPPAIHYVRDVAPKKIMLCVSFRVPEAVAFAGREGGQQQQQQQQQQQPGAGGDEAGQQAKKQRVGS